MTTRTRHFLKGLAKYGIGFGALAYVLIKNWDPTFNDEGVQKSPGISGMLRQTPEYAAFISMLLLCAAALVLQYYRWYVLVRALDLPFTLGAALRLGLVGTCYNVFLPGAVGGDIVKAYYIPTASPGAGPRRWRRC